MLRLLTFLHGQYRFFLGCYVANVEPCRRKLNNRGSRHPDFVGVDSALIDALWSYVQVKVEEITILIAKFFNMLISEAPLFESFEIDNVILRNSVALASW
jgi:hypothetical protein